MKKKNELELLKDELSKLDAKRFEILSRLSQYESPYGRFSKSGKIVNETIALIKQTGKAQSIKQLLAHLASIGVPIPPTNPSGFLSAVLSAEMKREYSRIIRNEYGLYTTIDKFKN